MRERADEELRNRTGRAIRSYQIYRYGSRKDMGWMCTLDFSGIGLAGLGQVGRLLYRYQFE